MEQARTIVVNGEVWNIEDGGPWLQGSGRPYRLVKFMCGERVRVGRIANTKDLSEATEEALGLTFFLGDD